MFQCRSCGSPAAAELCVNCRRDGPSRRSRLWLPGAILTVCLFVSIAAVRVAHREPAATKPLEDAGGAASEVTAPLIPGWVPGYPASEPENVSSARSGGTFHFSTGDRIPDILSYYERSLREAGFEIGANEVHRERSSSGGVLSARDGDGRSLVVTAASGEQGSDVSVLFQDRLPGYSRTAGGPH